MTLRAHLRVLDGVVFLAAIQAGRHGFDELHLQFRIAEEIIFFDEPTSALDPELIGEVLGVMRQLAEEGMTMLVVTHEMDFARNVSSHVLFMDGGKVIESGPSKEFFANPREERSREFIRAIREARE